MSYSDASFLLYTFHYYKHIKVTDPAQIRCNCQSTLDFRHFTQRRNRSIVENINLDELYPITKTILQKKLENVPYVGVLKLYSERYKKWFVMVQYFDETCGIKSAILSLNKSPNDNVSCVLTEYNLLPKVVTLSTRNQLKLTPVDLSAIKDDSTNNIIGVPDLRTLLLYAFRKAVGCIAFPLEQFLLDILTEHIKLPIGDHPPANHARNHPVSSTYTFWKTGFPKYIEQHYDRIKNDAAAKDVPFFQAVNAKALLAFVNDFYDLISIVLESENDLALFQNVHNLKTLINEFITSSYVPEPVVEIANAANMDMVILAYTCKRFYNTFQSYTSIPPDLIDKLSVFDFVHCIGAVNYNSTHKAYHVLKKTLKQPDTCDDCPSLKLEVEFVTTMFRTFRFSTDTIERWIEVFSYAKEQNINVSIIKKLVHFGYSLGVFDTYTKSIVKHCEDVISLFPLAATMKSIMYLPNYEMSCLEFMKNIPHHGIMLRSTRAMRFEDIFQNLPLFDWNV